MALFSHHQSPTHPHSSTHALGLGLVVAAAVARHHQEYSPPSPLYIISETEHAGFLATSPWPKSALPHRFYPRRRLASPLRPAASSNKPSLSILSMATLAYASSDAHMGAPGSPPELTSSKSSKSSSLHSSTLSDMMGQADLSHFEDINLDDIHGPSVFPMPLSPSGRVVFEASKPSMSRRPQTHSFRDLTNTSRPRFANKQGQVEGASRSQPHLNAPGNLLRRGLRSPSTPTLPNAGLLSAPGRRSRSPSPSQTYTSAPRPCPRRSSHNLDASMSPSASRRQSWQTAARKTVKEREAECDDEDDEVPGDAFIWNVPMSPRPMQERSPVLSVQGSPPRSSLSLAPSRSPSRTGKPSSVKTSPSRPSQSPGPLSPSLSRTSSQSLSRQRTYTWDETYSTLDADAKNLTEALEVYQSEMDLQQETHRQQPKPSRSPSSGVVEPKRKAVSLPPIRKSDPLIDPLQPSAEKQKYLSRTRPSWLPPKNPKEEKKHLKEYQRMLARVKDFERLEAQRQQEESAARDKAERIKAEYWTTLLLPNWSTEMTKPEVKSTHRKMWWNGIPAKLRGQVWAKAIGNELQITEATYRVALDKVHSQIQELGPTAALNGTYAHLMESSQTIFPDLKMFAPDQPLHQDLVDTCTAYTAYRPDVPPSQGTQHTAALLLLNMGPAQAFAALSNLLNRPLPLSFLVDDTPATHAAYAATLSALARKHALLAARLAALAIEPRAYLADMFASLFCHRLPVDLAARVMDVYALEGDRTVPRVAVALCGLLEPSCLAGGVADVLAELTVRDVAVSPDAFMTRVYEAGKKEAPLK